MASESGSAARKVQRNREMAAELKRLGIERRSGVCPVCYRTSPNDTFGGSGAFHHYPAGCCGTASKGT
jgi:hypothetical protein